MEIWQIILIIVGGVLILGLLGYLSFCLYISNMMANMMVYPKHFKTTEEKKASNTSYGDIGDTSKYQRIPINFTMSDGYVIHGDYSLNNPKKFVICMHGHRGNREGLQKYSWALYRLGYSLVFYDHRSHGDENKREKVTMSYQEHKDALEIINKRTKKNPVQVLVTAVENTAPREETTRIKYGGIGYQVAVDISPQRRVDLSLGFLTRGTLQSSFKNRKSVAECLADELILASEEDSRSFALQKAEEKERVAKAAH